MERLDSKRNSDIFIMKHRHSTIGLSKANSDLSGEGLFNFKKKFINKFLDGRPKVLNDIIKSDGDVQVVKVEVCRVPIIGVFRKLLNLFSLGKLNREMQKLNYSQLFHLYGIIHLENGKVFSIEKNQRIDVYKERKKGKKAECLSTSFSGATLEEFITAPEKVNMKDLYRYQGLSTNCQDYQKRLLNANGINKFDTFIMQKVDTLVPGVIKTISNRITDFAGILDFVYKGGGVEVESNL